MTVCRVGSRAARAARMATVLPVPTSPVMAPTAFSLMVPGDPGGGLVVRGVPVCAVVRAAGRGRTGAGEPEVLLHRVDHDCSFAPGPPGRPLISASCCW